MHCFCWRICWADLKSPDCSHGLWSTRCKSAQSRQFNDVVTYLMTFKIICCLLLANIKTKSWLMQQQNIMKSLIQNDWTFWVHRTITFPFHSLVGNFCITSLLMNRTRWHAVYQICWSANGCCFGCQENPKTLSHVAHCSIVTFSGFPKVGLTPTRALFGTRVSINCKPPQNEPFSALIWQ